MTAPLVSRTKPLIALCANAVPAASHRNADHETCARNKQSTHVHPPARDASDSHAKTTDVQRTRAQERTQPRWQWPAKLAGRVEAVPPFAPVPAKQRDSAPQPGRLTYLTWVMGAQEIRWAGLDWADELSARRRALACASVRRRVALMTCGAGLAFVSTSASYFRLVPRVLEPELRRQPQRARLEDVERLPERRAIRDVLVLHVGRVHDVEDVGLGRQLILAEPEQLPEARCRAGSGARSTAGRVPPGRGRSSGQVRFGTTSSPGRHGPTQLAA